MVLLDIKRKIREIIADVLEIGTETIDDEADLEKDLGCSTGECLVILNRIRNACKIDICYADIKDITKVSQLFELASKKAGVAA